MWAVTRKNRQPLQGADAADVMATFAAPLEIGPRLSHQALTGPYDPTHTEPLLPPISLSIEITHANGRTVPIRHRYSKLATTREPITLPG